MSETKTPDPDARYALLLIVRVRLRAFEAKFGRLPEPNEPIFFDETQDHPVRASISEARAQLERGAREAGVKVGPVLRFLRLSPGGKVRSLRQTD